MVGTLVMAPKSVTFRRHDHLVSVLFGDLLSHSYNIRFSMFLYLVTNTDALVIENITLASSNNNTGTLLINACGKLLFINCTFNNTKFRIVIDCRSTTDSMSSSVQPTQLPSHLSVILYM